MWSPLIFEILVALMILVMFKTVGLGFPFKHVRLTLDGIFKSFQIFGWEFWTLEIQVNVHTLNYDVNNSF